MTIGPSTNKSEPPDDDGQQRDNVLSRIHQCLSFPFFDVAMLVFQRGTGRPVWPVDDKAICSVA